MGKISAFSCMVIAQGFVDMHKSFDIEWHGGLTQVYRNLISSRYGKVRSVVHYRSSLHSIVIPANKSTTGYDETYEWYQ